MDLRQCLDNLRHDLSNGGVKEDTFAMICYVTMANKAHQLLKNNASSQKARDDAGEYLAVCSSSGSNILRCIAEG